MNKKTALLLHLLLLVIVVIELCGRISGNIRMEYPVKPLIMIWMSAYFLLHRRKPELTRPVLLAFFFSWLGDILLMFSDRDERFFFAGVGGFFLAQLSYIIIFTRYSESGGKGYLQKNLIVGFLFLGYVAGIFYLLNPGLEGVMKPVLLIYALSLIGMSMMALNRKGRVNRTSFLLVFIGSVLFVLSDSMIALDKFYRDIPLAGFWIMLTYIAAQYLILRGLLLERA
ncbi:MAG: lysoplasmalogenase [Bacteroidales bacterium]